MALKVEGPRDEANGRVPYVQGDKGGQGIWAREVILKRAAPWKALRITGVAKRKPPLHFLGGRSK